MSDEGAADAADDRADWPADKRACKGAAGGTRHCTLSLVDRLPARAAAECGSHRDDD